MNAKLRPAQNNKKCFKYCHSIVICCLIASLLLVAGCAPGTASVSSDSTGSLSDSTRQVPVNKASLTCNYFNSRDFYRSLGITRTPADAIPSTSGKVIAGGTIPHHLLAADIIATFFKSLPPEKCKTVVILGPDHQSKKAGKIKSSSACWNTAFGQLEADGLTLQKLAQSQNITMDDETMASDHAISAVIPYVKYYMPDAHVVPLLLRANMSLRDCRALGQSLHAILPEDSIVIASCDFSHYLTQKEALQMDEETCKAILSRDLMTISTMGNEHVDSPPSIMTLLTVMTERGVSDTQLIAHGNSADYGGGNTGSTTSYLSFLFQK